MRTARCYDCFHHFRRSKRGPRHVRSSEWMINDHRLDLPRWIFSSQSANSFGRPTRPVVAQSVASFSSSITDTKNGEQSNNIAKKRPPEKRPSLGMQRVQQNLLRRQYRQNQQRQQQWNYNQRAAQHPNARVESPVSSVAVPNPSQQPNGPTAAEVKTIMDQWHHDLTLLLRQLDAASVDANDPLRTSLPIAIPIWEVSNHPSFESESILTEHQSVFDRTIEIQNQLKQCVELKWIRPGTIHRHEFVALIGDILQIYSSLSSNVTTDARVSCSALLVYTLELIDWIKGPPLGLELSHKQCHAVITVAAKCKLWATAAQIYIDHIDPDIAGYIPVPAATISARTFTVAGLYCVARAALETSTLPVENVFDAVTKLTMVSPSDTENCKWSMRALVHFIGMHFLVSHC